MQFIDRFVRERPGDPMVENRLRPEHRACYSRASPTAVAKPELIALVFEWLCCSNGEEAQAGFATVVSAGGEVPSRVVPILGVDRNMVYDDPASAARQPAHPTRGARVAWLDSSFVRPRRLGEGRVRDRTLCAGAHDRLAGDG